MAVSCVSRKVTTGAITASQFLENFQKAWTSSRLSWAGRRAEQRIPRKLGLAVSGGADSMALAYLCKQLEKKQLVDGMSVTAFVVDHKAREESSREANTVARWLADMGVQTEILELEWPKGVSMLSAFETHARRLRFQALGKACRDKQIEALLMGHHRDDNVETTLWRLSSGARGAGLAGIPQVARIPECHGLYGVSESGSSYTPYSRKMSTLLEKRDGHEHEPASVRVSTGGILICRPLLSFPKANLLATCDENQVPFVSDPTNFDPTLTPRNAIRSLLSSNRFPRALQAPSILPLIQRSQNLLTDSITLSNQLLQQCKILDLNLKSGTMKIQFPPETLPDLSRAKPTHQPTQIQALTLRRITELISPFPENHFPLRSYEPFTHRLFSPSPIEKVPSFTLGGVMFQPLQRGPGPDQIDPSSTVNVNSRNIWLLSRQPFMRNRLPTLHFKLPVPVSTFTPWALWDNRYWFRFTLVSDRDVSDSSHDPILDPSELEDISLILRPLQQSDLQTIRQMLEEQYPGKRSKNPALESVLKMLSGEAPGQTRFTLPVLAMEGGSQGLGQQVLLGLPTMDIWLPSAPKTRELPQMSAPWKIQWEWMYKMIDNDLLKLMGWL